MSMFGGRSLSDIVIIILVLVVSLSIHEAMHAFVGYKLGDTTAHDEGRISLNPLRHIDPVMTVALPVVTIFLFGAPILAAKPVPFDPEQVKYDEFGAAMIAAAGPLSNFVIALIAALLLGATGSGLVARVLEAVVELNVGLFIFNIIPIPPLDGSRVLYAFAPEPLQRVMAQIEPIGIYIVLLLALTGGFGHVLGNLNQSVLNFLTHFSGGSF